MSYHPLKLDDFGQPAPVAPSFETVDTEALRLEAYEAGYKSGWEDAAKEREQSGAQIAANLERNLNDISFSYEEARQEVLSGFSGLFEQILNSFLPALASSAVLPQVQGEMAALLSELGAGKCTLVASPTTCPELEWLSENHMETDIEIKPEAAFGDGRVQLQVGAEMREIDLSAMIASMAEAIRDFMQTNSSEEDAKYG